MPRLAGIFQPSVNVVSDSLPQVSNFRVGNRVWELAYVVLESSIHQLKAADQKFLVLIKGLEKKS